MTHRRIIPEMSGSQKRPFDVLAESLFLQHVGATRRLLNFFSSGLGL
jgi:hypothetical protein